jgi:hypothetical protein
MDPAALNIIGVITGLALGGWFWTWWAERQERIARSRWTQDDGSPRTPPE